MPLRYRHCDFALLRSTTHPGDIDIPSGLNLDRPDAINGEGRMWLAKTWVRDDIREALTVASPQLAEHVDRLLAAGPQERHQDLRRVLVSVTSYLVRWERRVTPFGLFAGVMPVTVGTPARTLDTHRVVARADADWIAALTSRLERDPALRPHLMVVADNTSVARDGRVLLARREGPGARVPGPIKEASARCTRPVRAALDIAASPVRFRDLVDELGKRFPSAAAEKIRSLLDGLVDEGFLITSLRAPMTTPDPLAHLASALPAAGPRCELGQVRDGLRAHHTSAGPGLPTSVTERMEALAPATRYPLAVDVRLGGQVALPERVLDEAAAAAGTLLRLTRRPFGSMAWMEYHAQFRERYGPGALVPVRELLSDAGLGYPDGYLNTRRARPAHRMLTERDAALLALIQQAMSSRVEEIVLTEPVIESLVTDDLSAMVPPQRVELGVTLHASSLEAIGHWDFELRVVAAPRIPTSMAGRFAHLLTGPERDRLAATYLAGQAEDAMAVQVSFPPCVPHNENVARVAPLLEHVLPVGEHPSPDGADAVSVDDLAVTTDAAQLYLVHVPTGRRVVPRVPHALELTTRTPPLARFLAQVADARTAGFGPLDPGAARVLPYLPRFRYRRTVLAPARWLLGTTDVSSGGDWLGAWRSRWRVPARIVACDGELRLPLNLDHALDRSLLRARLDRAGRLELREDAPPGGDGWLGRPAELLIPLILDSPPPRPLPVTAPPGRTCLPGASGVVCARLTGNPDRFGDLTAFHLPRLATSLAGITERWWVCRYRDMIHPWSPQHVAVCLRLSDRSAFAEAAAGIAAFAVGLSARGLPGQVTLVPYHEHPGRYDSGDAMTAAEKVFAADTAAAIAQLTTGPVADVPAQALAAASMAQLAAAFFPGRAEGYQALTKCLEQGSGPLDRHARDLACRLADPADDFKELRALPGGDKVADAWRVRDTALAAYHQALAGQRDPGTMLRTLLHEHHMRAVGLDPGTEQRTGRLARAAALQRLALSART